MPPPPANKPAQRTEALYKALLARILSGEIPAGARLPPERELALSYDTNRNTLREAIRRLEQARLVSARQGQGVTVLDFRRTGTLDLLGPFLTCCLEPADTARVLLDLLEPRLHVFELLLATAAQKATAADLQKLQEAIDVMIVAERERDAIALIAGQDAWLDALVDATQSLPIRWMANPLLRATREVLEHTTSLMPFEPSYATFCAELLVAISAHDADTAVAAAHRFHAVVDQGVRAALLPLAQRAQRTDS